MASITLDHVNISYPLLNNNRSLRGKLIKSIQNKRMGVDGNDRIVINALNDLNFSLKNGDRVGLIGTNGAGKSTLLRMLAGIYTPTSGKCIVDGKIASILNIGVGMRDNVTGHENIYLGCLLVDMGVEEIRRKTPEIAEFTGLGDYLHLPVSTYSAGMRTRLAFGIATAVDPDILLIDEVIGAGDHTFIKLAEERIATLVKSSSIMLLASHTADTIRQFCNKALWLEKGAVRAFGPVDDVLRDYEAQ